MRPKIQRNLKALEFPIFRPLIEVVLYTKYYFQLNKHLYKEEKVEMYRVMKRIGFIEGVEVTRSRYNSAVEDEKRQKEKMLKNYSRGIHGNPFEKKEEIIDPNYMATVNDVKTFKKIYEKEQNGISLIVTDKVHGKYYCLIQSSHLVKPKLLRGENYTKTFARALEVFDEIHTQFVGEEVIEPKQIKRSSNAEQKQTRKRKPKSENVDISHVQKAMGIDTNEQNQNKDDDNDLDNLLKGLF